jgi:hypothetical protein
MYYEPHLGPHFDAEGNTLRGMTWYELNKERIDRQRANRINARKGGKNKRRRKRR